MLDLQTLVLNADYRPLSYNPLSLWSWKDAFTALFLDRVTLVASYDVEARSPSRSLRVPSVVALKSSMTLARSPAFTRYNIYLRDTFSCQYCGLRLPSGGLTFDHVVPRSRGGLSSWENVVAACSPCNLRKANRTPAEAEMPLLNEPHARPGTSCTAASRNSTIGNTTTPGWITSTGIPSSKAEPASEPGRRLVVERQAQGARWRDDGNRRRWRRQVSGIAVGDLRREQRTVVRGPPGLRDQAGPENAGRGQAGEEKRAHHVGRSVCRKGHTASLPFRRS